MKSKNEESKSEVKMFTATCKVQLKRCFTSQQGSSNYP